MPKRPSQSPPTLSVPVLSGISVFLVCVIIFLAWKNQEATLQYTTRLSQVQQQISFRRFDLREEAQLLALIIATQPIGKPLVNQPKDLQVFVSGVSTQLRRDIVVVSKNRVILADTIPTNVGTKYTEDKENEIQETLTQGATRTFVETSRDYPQGITQTVVPMKDSKGTILGVLIVSSSQITQ